MDIVLLIVGFIALLLGADSLVKGAARIAERFGISALVIGLTVVAFGTSMPEQVISLIAALDGSSDITIGNVIGSNIFNTTLILGIAGLIYPIAIASQLVKRDIPILIVVTLISFGLATTQQRIDRPEGGFLFLGVLGFTALSYYMATQEKQFVVDEATNLGEDILSIGTPISLPREIIRTLVGVGILVVGANMAVEGATGIAEAAGISERIIALTLVAAGTSLPELATSMVAALRKASDIAVGNVVGSNIFNLTSILGITALVKPIDVSSSFLNSDFPILILITLLLLPFVADRKLQRTEALLFLTIFVMYTIYLFLR